MFNGDVKVQEALGLKKRRWIDCKQRKREVFIKLSKPLFLMFHHPAEQCPMSRVRSPHCSKLERYNGAG